MYITLDIPCVHRGEPAGSLPAVGGEVPVYQCAIFGRCQVGRHGVGAVNCLSCRQRQLPAISPPAESPGTTSVTPSLPKRVATYSVAVAKWIAAGRPKRDAAEIERLHAICVACPQYDALRKACGRCGCAVNLRAVPLTNKLAMPTETCPLGKW